MGRYIARRLLLAIPVLFVISILIFGGVRMIPGNVCLIVLGSAEAVERCPQVEHDLGLDQPVAKQYVHWLGRVLQGDLGRSMVNRRPVASEIQTRMYATLELAILAGAFAVALALPIGVYSALKQDKLADVSLRVITVGWLAMPSFWVGSMLITLPAKWWGYSPPVPYVQIWDDPLKNLEQMYLPAIALGLALSATLARITRSSMLEVLRQDYIRTARAKGLAERVVLYKHALKNAMLPVITIFGLQLGFLLGGTVVLESLFALPGLGTLLLSAVLTKDFTQVQGLVLFFATIIILINLIVDLSYAWFDPRVRYS
ncbi:MAG TPA: ABC transporter permease [Dehalococcoidia bacterium]|nr:ABC transporter permease [Dehalococcoidia bacterium]